MSEMRMEADVRRTGDSLVRLFLLVPLGMFVTALAYYVLSMVFYHPGPGAAGGREVFLLPRYHPGQNGLPSGMFAQWRELMLLLPVQAIVLLTCLRAALSRRLSFGKLLTLGYLAALGTALSFVLLTPSGWEHLDLQARSINNGAWDGVHDLLGRLAARSISPFSLDALRVVFRELFSNAPDYTITGATHPPGSMVLCLYYLKALTTLVPWARPSVAWSVGLTVLNALLVPVAGLTARRVLPPRQARLSVAALVAVPSVCLHFNAVLDGVATVWTAAGALLVLAALNRLHGVHALEPDGRRIMGRLGLGAGLFFTLAAQMTYGHAVPIIAFLVAFLAAADWSKPRLPVLFLLGLAVAPLAYFSLELFLSAGASFYPIRALGMVKAVNVSSRPFPLTHYANFTVMAVMGGFFFLPALLHSAAAGPRFAMERLAGLLGRARRGVGPRGTARGALAMAVLIMLLFLTTQQTVRLEVERTWHWFFVPGWTLAGLFLAGATVACRRALPRSPAARNGFYVLSAILLAQLLASFALAVSIQDYY